MNSTDMFICNFLSTVFGCLTVYLLLMSLGKTR